MGHVILLVRTDKESFESGLTAWHIKWKTFLGERKIDAAGKNHICAKKLRSAYWSFVTNLPRLFIWYDNMHLKMPNTTNVIAAAYSGESEQPFRSKRAT